MVASTNCKYNLKGTERLMESNQSKPEEDRVSLLSSTWEALLAESGNGEKELLEKFGLEISNVPQAPHLENCKLNVQINKRLDTRVENSSFAPWTNWKGFLDLHPTTMNNEQLRYYRQQAMSEGAYPPWVCFGVVEVINNSFIVHYYPRKLMHFRFGNEFIDGSWISDVSTCSCAFLYFLFI